MSPSFGASRDKGPRDDTIYLYIKVNARDGLYGEAVSGAGGGSNQHEKNVRYLTAGTVQVAANERAGGRPGSRVIKTVALVAGTS